MIRHVGTNVCPTTTRSITIVSLGSHLRHHPKASHGQGSFNFGYIGMESVYRVDERLFIDITPHIIVNLLGYEYHRKVVAVLRRTGYRNHDLSIFETISCRIPIQISNVGFLDVTETAVVKAASEGTLFIHGSVNSGGSVANLVAQRQIRTQTLTDCTSVCGSVGASRLPVEMSAFCDPTCSPKWSAGGPRFGGHLCGAGDVSWFGSSCRLCYTDQDAALAADLALASPDAESSDLHVVMCSTTKPPADVRCSPGCKKTDDAVRTLKVSCFLCVFCHSVVG